MKGISAHYLVFHYSTLQDKIHFITVLYVHGYVLWLECTPGACFDSQDAWDNLSNRLEFIHITGSWMVNVVPRSGPSLWTVISPW